MTLLVVCAFLSRASSQTVPPPAGDVCIVEIQGAVEVLPQGASNWSPAQTNQLLHPQDRLRSAANSRVALRWSNQSIVSFGASTELEILPPNAADDQAGLHLIHGIFSFFHRDKPGHIRIITRGAVAGVEGTEFAMSVDNADDTTLSVLDGKVRLGNDQGSLLLTNGEQAVVSPGKAPTRTAGFIANNLLQWCFYYPAVIDPEEIQFTPDEQAALAKSLDAYRGGDLLAALALYPAGRETVSDRERVYHAALYLSVGEVAETEKLLATIPEASGRPAQLALALRQLIAAVKLQPSVFTAPPVLASELLADSYFEQSRAVRETSLEKALQLAKQATTVSPQFGFAWERRAELEFSFGRTRVALKDLDKSLALAPHNAQALALTGFILTAQGEPKQARRAFDRAIAADAALGNAWLGRGIVRIHLGDKSGGREDLLVAAALEPQRAELRSYLGKAYANSGDYAHAYKELNLAKKLDPKDPTAWLYSALVNERDNQINDAIRDLEKSQSLNDNRSVYRSQLLLDQDSATRSANLAWMYQDDGLSDLSLREAQRAVSTDYANYSAHLFLADSYNNLRDPNWANLRYETPASVEMSLADLLSPASAGVMSANGSEGPYANLFDQNRFGVVSDTTYLDRGAWSERGAQYGTSDKLSYIVDSTYQDDPGQRNNEDRNSRSLSVELKYQLTPQDMVLFDVNQFKYDEGDIRESYYNTGSIYPYRQNESQNPNLYLGFHHEWSPGVHTLFLATSGHANNTTIVTNASHWIFLQADGTYPGVPELIDHEFATISEKIYTAELQQIWETPKHTTVVGARYSQGSLTFGNIEWYPQSFTADDFNLGPFGPGVLWPFLILQQYFTDDFHHESFYAYHDWQVFDSLKLSAGIAYDFLEQPAVVNTLPFSTQEKGTAQTSPKFGFIWTPFKNTVVRAAYTRSLSGLADDSSLRLEPSEVAGFNQAYRSIIPDSVVGDTSGSRLDTIDISLEQKFDTGTYLAIGGEILYSHLLKDVGAFYFNTADDSTQVVPIPQGMEQSLDYCERTLTLSADQLLGKQWAVGARYRLSQANLDTSWVQFPAYVPPVGYGATFMPRQNFESILHTITLHANWNHPSGLFSILEADWYHQDNLEFSPPEPGDDFWQFNVSFGCRFFHRKAELSAGILNLTDQHYNLEPLNLYNEMAQSRTFFVRFLLHF